MIEIKRHPAGSNIVTNPLEVKTVKVSGTSLGPDTETVAQEIESSAGSESTGTNTSTTAVPLTEAEKRAKRREEYRDAALVRERAVNMQKQAQDQIKQTHEFYTLMQQAKEDPIVLAKALNMSPEEFQRKLFNKMYSIKEDAPVKKEETFEEQTKRKLQEYEQEREMDKQRRAEEAQKHSEVEFQRVKHSYVTDNILPLINETHEFIQRNDKYSCAAFIYDLMNQAYQEAQNTKQEFTLKAEDVVNQLEEELEKNARQQLEEARKIGKLKNHFRDDAAPSDALVPRKDFRKVSSNVTHSSPTLSNTLGASLSPAVSSPAFGASSPAKKIPLSNRQARLEAAKRNLGSQ